MYVAQLPAEPPRARAPPFLRGAVPLARRPLHPRGVRGEAGSGGGGGASRRALRCSALHGACSCVRVCDFAGAPVCWQRPRRRGRGEGGGPYPGLRLRVRWGLLGVRRGAREAPFVREVPLTRACALARAPQRSDVRRCGEWPPGGGAPRAATGARGQGEGARQRGGGRAERRAFGQPCTALPACRCTAERPLAAGRCGALRPHRTCAMGCDGLGRLSGGGRQARAAASVYVRAPRLRD